MTSHPHRASHWLMLVALAIMWGSAFTLTKVAVASLPPALVVAGRLGVACCLLVPAALLRRRRESTSLRLWAFLLLIALFGYIVPFSLVSWGQAFIDSGLAGILMAVMPLATLGLAHLLIPGERITPYRAGGFICGFAGVGVLMGPTAWSELLGGRSQLLPMLAVLGGAMSYAVSSILARLRPPSDALHTAAVTIAVSLVVMLPIAAAEAPSSLATIGDAQLMAIGLLGVFSTALAAVVYFRLVKVAGPSFVSQLNYLIPLWAVGSGIVFLDEQPESRHLYALALILGGILITQLEWLHAVRRERGKRARLGHGGRYSNRSR